MSRQRKTLLWITVLLMVPPMVTIACPPDCGYCYYWTGWGCAPQGQCQTIGGCAAECERCADCNCVPVDLYCRYWHDDCWYCDSNGVCLNSCTSNQVCIDGQCVTLSVTASKQNPVLCEDVTFTATTEPPGYASQVQWSAPGGQPGWSNDPCSTFTTHWSSKGNKTVTATLLTLSELSSINVTLPSGCTQGQEYVALEVDTIEVNEDHCNGIFPSCGYTRPVHTPPISTILVDISAHYNNGAWEFFVVASQPVECGACRTERIIDVSGSSASALSQDNYCDIVNHMNGSTGCLGAGDVSYTSYGCVEVHEQYHAAFYQYRLDTEGEFYLTEYTLPDPVPVNCSDPATTTCQAVVDLYGPYIEEAVKDEYNSAWQYMLANSEQLAIQKARSCFEGVATGICDYAETQNWNDPNCCQ